MTLRGQFTMARDNRSGPRPNTDIVVLLHLATPSITANHQDLPIDSAKSAGNDGAEMSLEGRGTAVDANSKFLGRRGHRLPEHRGQVIVEEHAGGVEVAPQRLERFELAGTGSASAPRS